jgi:hypothetical protein
MAQVMGQSTVPFALDIGARYADCRSALQVGPQECNGKTGDATDRATTQSAALSESFANQQMESQIDAYLASYGKPPREAVRALLEPSDENIRSFLAQQEKTLSLAGYVAARMTSLKHEAGAALSSPGVGYRDDASFSRMRVTLHQNPRDASNRPAMRALAELARSAPALQAGVALAGPMDAAQLKEAIGRIDPALVVTAVPAQAMDAARMPFLRIEDLQSHATYDIDAHELSVEQLREAVLAVRRGGAGGGEIGNSLSAPEIPPGSNQ